MNSTASARHHGENIVTLFDEQTGELGRLVGGDRAGDAEHNAFRSSWFGFRIGGHRSWIKLRARRLLKWRSASMILRNFCKSSSIDWLMIV